MILDVTHESDDDMCPMCNSDLGRPRGATRRQIIFCEAPGVFRWRCPDCAGIWQVRAAAQPALP